VNQVEKPLALKKNRAETGFSAQVKPAGFCNKTSGYSNKKPAGFLKRQFFFQKRQQFRVNLMDC